MLFGANAVLNTGSFHASTADYFRLGSGADRFYADPGQSSVLSNAFPEAFGFLGSGVKPISVDGAQLAVPDGENLSLIGGNIDMSNGAPLDAAGGAVYLAAVNSAGEVIPTGTGLDVSSFTALADISLAGMSEIDVSGDGAGSVFVRCRQFSVTDGGIRAVTSGAVDGGTVSIEARDIIFGSNSYLHAYTAGSGRGANAVLRATNSISFNNSDIVMLAVGVGNDQELLIDSPLITGSFSMTGKLLFDVDTSSTCSADISGANALVTKRGDGALTISGANTYGGGTFVNGGTLWLNGSVASTTTVNAGGTLGGTGTTGGMTVQGGRHRQTGHLDRHAQCDRRRYVQLRIDARGGT